MIAAEYRQQKYLLLLLQLQLQNSGSRVLEQDLVCAYLRREAVLCVNTSLLIAAKSCELGCMEVVFLSGVSAWGICIRSLWAACACSWGADFRE